MTEATVETTAEVVADAPKESKPKKERKHKDAESKPVEQAQVP